MNLAGARNGSDGNNWEGKSNKQSMCFHASAQVRQSFALGCPYICFTGAVFPVPLFIRESSEK